MKEYKAYCVRCRTMKQVKDPQVVTTKRGGLGVRGICPDCGTKVFKFIPKDKTAQAKEEKVEKKKDKIVKVEKVKEEKKENIISKVVEEGLKPTEEQPAENLKAPETEEEVIEFDEVMRV